MRELAQEMRSGGDKIPFARLGSRRAVFRLLEIPMKLTTILTLGAIALATPALAASADSQMMNSGNASASDSKGAAIVSSVPDTEKPYKDSSRAKDFQKEAETIKQLNQQIANGNASSPQQ
jgi:hypothetical protein